MMKRSPSSTREENYEHVLMCLICRSLFDDHDHQPKFLPCHHTFCKDCLREYVRQMGDEIECPSCRKIANVPAAGVAAMQTNFYVKYIQSLVQGGPGIPGPIKECEKHPNEKMQFFCKDCSVSICKLCCAEGAPCKGHSKVPLTTITEESHQRLESAFCEANATIEVKKIKLEALLKALSEEKDQALLKIDSTFEQHIHTLNRRATLLKNKVIAIYNEHTGKLESDMEEISTAMTCIVSLKDYHETKISHGEFAGIDTGIEEMDEVHTNINTRINPRENHILFEEKHGTEKYKACAKDLGRVKCSRPTIPRTEPEGNDAEACSAPPATSPMAEGGEVPVETASQSGLAHSSPLKSDSLDTPSDSGDANGNIGTESCLEGACGEVRTHCSSSENCENETESSSSAALPQQENVMKKSDVNGLEADADEAKCVDKENNPVPDQAPQAPKPMLLKPGPMKLDLQGYLGPSAGKDGKEIKVDKTYYHLLYTSYDEEELLKELRSGRTPAELMQQVMKNNLEQQAEAEL